MILGTYANLYAMEESSNTRLSITTTPPDKPIIRINDPPLANIMLKAGFPLIPQQDEEKERIVQRVKGSYRFVFMEREQPAECRIKKLQFEN